MKQGRLDEMTKGWFVGNFEPTLYRTKDVEVAVKYYCAGDSEDAHYHKIATELTVILYGTVCMNGLHYHSGDIIVMEPGDITDFKAITDTANIVVKIPGVNHDKYSVEGEKLC